MQLGAGGGQPVAAAKLVYGEAGLRGMYAGLSAAVTRQAVYTTLRVGLYDWIRVRGAGGGPVARECVLHTYRQREPSLLRHTPYIPRRVGSQPEFPP